MLSVIMLNISYKPFLQNVVMLNEIMLSVVAPQLVFVSGNLIQPSPENTIEETNTLAYFAAA